MKGKYFIIGATFLAAGFVSVSAWASHSWGGYHWPRPSDNPVSLTIINSTTSDWDQYVTTAIADWHSSSVLTLTQNTNGDTTTKTRRSCNGGTGTIRVCNLAYGQNGWLGLAGISIDSNGHITSGYTKLNDSYFSASYGGGYYASDLWKQSVTCQELGHDFGLDHQDENFDNQSLFSCMDYQDPPFAHPNQHDYDQLVTIYSHVDSGGGGGGSGCNAPQGKGCNASSLPGSNGDIGWGASLGRRGNAETFIRIDPDGTMHLTHVTWAIGY